MRQADEIALGYLRKNMDEALASFELAVRQGWWNPNMENPLTQMPHTGSYRAFSETSLSYAAALVAVYRK